LRLQNPLQQLQLCPPPHPNPPVVVVGAVPPVSAALLLQPIVVLAAVAAALDDAEAAAAAAVAAATMTATVTTAIDDAEAAAAAAVAAAAARATSAGWRARLDGAGRYQKATATCLQRHGVIVVCRSDQPCFDGRYCRQQVAHRARGCGAGGCWRSVSSSSSSSTLPLLAA